MKRSVFILAILLVLLSAAAPQLVSADGEYDAALQLYYKGDYAEAVKNLKEYVEKKPDPAAYYLIGYGLYELGRYGEADEYFQQAYLIDPTFSPEESGLTEQFPKGLPRGIQKPHRVHKGRALIKKKKAVAGVATKPAAKQGVAPAGKKVTAKAAAAVTQPAKGIQPSKTGKPATGAEKPAVQAQPQKPSPQPSGIQAKNAGQQKAVAPQKEAVPSAREAGPGGKESPSVLPTHPMSQKEMKKLLPLLAIPAAMGGLLAGFTFVFLVIVMAFYLYFALCLFLIAKKRDVPAPWTAWIPLVQLWTFVTSADKPWWWILLMFIPLLNIIVIVYLWMCISENLGRNKWLGLLWLVPLINLVFIGFLAFSKAAGADAALFEGSVPDDLPPVEHEDEF
jgi:hypothetical protein